MHGSSTSRVGREYISRSDFRDFGHLRDLRHLRVCTRIIK